MARRSIQRDFDRESVHAMRELTQNVLITGDIAYQTNLFALNSAIEAARAGTHDKGFAIFAGDVHKLADLSQTAAQQISDLAKESVAVAENVGALLERTLPDRQGLNSWTTIAVAGWIAARPGARSPAIFQRRTARNRGPTRRKQRKAIRRCCAAPAIQKQKIKPLQIIFRTLEGNQGVGSISPEDVDRMPRQYRDQSALRTALEEAERVCHDPGQWQFIEELAIEVMKALNGTLDRTEIEKILGLELRSFGAVWIGCDLPILGFACLCASRSLSLSRSANAVCRARKQRGRAAGKAADKKRPAEETHRLTKVGKRSAFRGRGFTSMSRRRPALSM